ncbi:MAG: hypothetical protein ACRDHZ_14375 [Ktedonobacteraceae bacterium]
MVPGTPQYLLRSPDSHEIPFAETLRRYNGFEPGGGWMDLRPEMELRIENAYYRPGVSRQGLHGFLGTEIARFRVQVDGTLRLLSVRPLKDRPRGEPPVQQLIPRNQRRYHYHRFYYEVFFRKGHARGSVLIGANTQRELQTDPHALCGKRSARCIVFPEECTVSIEMEIVVNGAPRNVIWDSDVASVVNHPQHIQLLRRCHGRLTEIKLNPHDPRALQMPLLPGDNLNWK